MGERTRDRVRPGSGTHLVQPRQAGDRVVAAKALENVVITEIGSIVARQHVLAGGTVHHVIAKAAIQPASARTGRQRVITVDAIDLVSRRGRHMLVVKSGQGDRGLGPSNRNTKCHEASPVAVHFKRFSAQPPLLPFARAASDLPYGRTPLHRPDPREIPNRAQPGPIRAPWRAGPRPTSRKGGRPFTVSSRGRSDVLAP